MPEWLESLIVAIGGGTVVLIGVLTIFKGLLIKLLKQELSLRLRRILKNSKTS